jgi:hypothetical protein
VDISGEMRDSVHSTPCRREWVVLL